MGMTTSVSNYAALLVLLGHFREKDIVLKFSFRGIPWKSLGKVITMAVAALGRAVLMVTGVLYGEEDRNEIRKIIMLPDAFGKRICCWFWKAWSCLSFLLRYFRKQHLGLLAYGSLFRQQKL
ncbi:hypothetical protein [Sporofaciens sp. SGI.106]|uniref:hypothetical protein n=1 Tax=Sporofaciens sp. SGI.106 TaxID=3420568 RepID=UPI003D0863ED